MAIVERFSCNLYNLSLINFAVKSKMEGEGTGWQGGFPWLVINGTQIIGLLHNQAQISREMGIAAWWVIYYFHKWCVIFFWKFRDGFNLSVAQNFWMKVILECLILH